MKSERRHELQQNELADWVGSVIRQVQPYWQLIAGTVVVVVGGSIVIALLSGRAEANREAAWAEYYEAFSARDPDLLARVGERFPDSDASVWAFLRVGDIALANGGQQLFVNRQLALEQLEKAKKAYEFVKDHAPDELLKQKAMCGLAQTLEAMNELDSAAEVYQEIEQTWPDTTVGEFAQERLEVVQNSDTQQFYQWFYEQSPKPPSSTESGSSTSPPIDFLPTNPDFSVGDQDTGSDTTAPATSDGVDDTTTEFGEIDFGDPGGDTSPPAGDSDDSDGGAAENEAIDFGGFDSDNEPADAGGDDAATNQADSDATADNSDDVEPPSSESE